VPGIDADRPITMSGDIHHSYGCRIHMDADQANPADVAEAAKRLFGAYFKYLFGPR
jgi:hypothetical protein